MYVKLQGISQRQRGCDVEKMRHGQNCTWTRTDSAGEPDNAGCATPPEVRQKPHIRITSKARAQQSACAQVRCVGRTRRYSLFLAGEIPVEDTKSLVLEATRFVIHFTHGSGTVCPRSQPQSYQETKTDAIT